MTVGAKACAAELLQRGTRLLVGTGLVTTMVLRIGGAVLMLFAFVSWLNYVDAAQTLRQQAEDTGQAQAQTAARQIDAALRTASTVVGETKATLEVLGDAPYAQQVAYVRHILAITPRTDAYDLWAYYEARSYKDKASQIWITRASWPNLIYVDYDFHTSPLGAWYVAPKRAGRLVFTPPYYGPVAKETLVSISAPMRAGSKYLGTVGSDIEVSTLSRIAAGLHFGDGNNGSYAFIFAAQGSLVAFPDAGALVGPSHGGQSVAAVQAGRFRLLLQAKGQAPVGVTLPGGAAALVYHEPIPTAGWTLAFVVPESAIYAPLDRLHQQTIALTAASLVVVLLVVVVLARGIVRPVRRVEQAARLLAKGDSRVDDLLPRGRRDEIGQLGEAFQRMVSYQREYVRVSEVLRISEQRLHAVIAHAPILLFAVDRRGIFTLVETGLQVPEEFPLPRPGEVVAGSWLAGEPEILALLERARTSAAFATYLELNGRVFEIWWFPELDQAGCVDGGTGVAVDVTASFKAQEQAEAARKAAEELAQLRSDFVATVSHELRTPLTSIVGYGEMLQSQWNVLSDEKRQDWLARIVLSANRQHKLVNDLLLLSRLENEFIEVSPMAANVAIAVSRAVDEIRGAYAGQNIDADGPADLLAQVDLARTIQILANLLDNAAKYSPVGSTIHVSWQQEGDRVCVRVRDAGPGVPAEGRGQLFTRFGRLPGSSMRGGHVGTGLGLYLGRLWAQAMGGDLDLEETGPAGSVFLLRLLPVPDSQARPAVAPPEQDERAAS